MRDLDQVLATGAGREFLRSEATFDDPAPWLAMLPSAASVYAHQQVYLDYRGSVVAKVQALRALPDRVRTDFLWIDTDRAGSDKLSLRVYVRGPQGPVPVRLAPAGCEHTEPRFIQTDPGRLRDAANHIEGILRSAPNASGRVERWRDLRPLVEVGGTLSELSRRLSDVLLRDVLGFVPRPVLVSHLGHCPALPQILDSLADFIAVYNERIATLRALGIDPKVRPLPDDYVPLFVTTPDLRRTRLRLVRDGGRRLARAVDRAGRSWCYELDAIDGARFSPDVTLPILLNDRYDGMVCGKSSALYLLVFGEVMRKVLGMTPVPVLVPPRWDVFGGAFDSLLDAYLDGRIAGPASRSDNGRRRST